jgi:hypothetical protein
MTKLSVFSDIVNNGFVKVLVSKEQHTLWNGCDYTKRKSADRMED